MKNVLAALLVASLLGCSQHRAVAHNPAGAAMLPVARVIVTVPQGAHTVTLTWVASTTSGVTYSVLRGTTAGAETPISGATGIKVLTYVDAAVVAGTTYFYEVVAVDASGNISVPSNEATAVVRPSAPTNPTIIKQQ